MPILSMFEDSKEKLGLWYFKSSIFAEEGTSFAGSDIQYQLLYSSLSGCFKEYSAS